MDKPYYVDFYDMFDGWSCAGCPECRESTHFFDDLEEAKKYCNKKNAELAEDNKRCGEHYGVIDLERNYEVYCPMQVT